MVYRFEAKYVHGALNDQPPVFEWVGQRTEKHKRVLTAWDYHGGRMQHAPCPLFDFKAFALFYSLPTAICIKRVEGLDI